MATKLQRLTALSKRVNIADDYDDTFLSKLADDVIRNYESDDGSRLPWLKRSEYAMGHALQIVKDKDTPFVGAANVKYPLLTVAALQFHARAYPEIVKNQSIVKAKVIGNDDDNKKSERAKRVTAYLNYQLFDEMAEWDEETDKLLLALAIEGCEFKKTYFDPTLQRNVSEWVRPKDLIVNNWTRNLARCPRITHRLYQHPYEIVQKQRAGTWSDVDLSITTSDDDDEILQEILEQHLLLDLDKDGLKEPYIVTVHKDSGMVVRIKADFLPENIVISGNGKTIELKELLFSGVSMDEIAKTVANIKIVAVNKFQHFTKIPFIPSPDGSFYDIGFGQLTGPLNDVVDTVINQLLDAGTLQNLGGGFVRKGMNINSRRGEVKFKIGEYKEVDIPSNMSIRDMIMPMQFGSPSSALFNLLGMAVQGVKDITSVQDIFTGGPQANETATTTMARVEQGLKVFTAIYKRILRAISSEIDKIYDLDAIYLKPETYFNVLDDNRQEVVTLKDFRGDGTDIQLTADATVSNTVLKQAKAQILRQELGNPIINGDEVMRRYFEALDIDNIDKLIIPADQRNQPSPEMIKLQIDMLESKVRSAKTEEEINEVKARVIKTYAQAVEAIANAESKEAGSQLAYYRQQLEELLKEADRGQRATGRMVATSGNAMADQQNAAPPAGLPDSGDTSNGQPGGAGQRGNPAGSL